MSLEAAGTARLNPSSVLLVGEGGAKDGKITRSCSWCVKRGEMLPALLPVNTSFLETALFLLLKLVVVGKDEYTLGCVAVWLLIEDWGIFCWLLPFLVVRTFCGSAPDLY